MGNTRLALAGLTPTDVIDEYFDDDLFALLEDIYYSPCTVKSDYARIHAPDIARAACLGLITTQQLDGAFCTMWRITSLGLQTLE
jgi:hypothetical protein